MVNFLFLWICLDCHGCQSGSVIFHSPFCSKKETFKKELSICLLASLPSNVSFYPSCFLYGLLTSSSCLLSLLPCSNLLLSFSPSDFFVLCFLVSFLLFPTYHPCFSSVLFFRLSSSYMSFPKCPSFHSLYCHVLSVFRKKKQMSLPSLIVSILLLCPFLKHPLLSTNAPSLPFLPSPPLLAS